VAEIALDVADAASPAQLIAKRAQPTDPRTPCRGSKCSGPRAGAYQPHVPMHAARKTQMPKMRARRGDEKRSVAPATRVTSATRAKMRAPSGAKRCETGQPTVSVQA
jgi:hypothetical protein